MRIARKMLLVVVAAMALSPMLGCGVGTTWEENQRTIRRVADYDARMMVDDLGLFTQTHRTTRTSRWIID